MFNDQQRPTDKLNLLSGGDNAGKAKDNVAKLTEMMEFAPLGWSTDAQYDKGKILLDQRYQHIAETEPKLLEPLMAHERVHAKHQSGNPTDEASLKVYVDEELEAYHAQHDTWQAIKDDYELNYRAPEMQRALGEAWPELHAQYTFLENEVEKVGWDGVRENLEWQYRRRMELNQ
ncbi:MAG: hypothetical protein JXA21_07420 [Anaerolineae bacterium]|nr:hypothetical protein [Anaerolineae bacterium]